MEIAKILSFSHYDDKMMHFLDPALRKANLYQTYGKLTPHSYAVRMKHMNATLVRKELKTEFQAIEDIPSGKEQ